MSNQNESESDKAEAENARRENRFMMISVVVVAVFLLGGMGINMLVHKESNASTVETADPSK